MVIGFLWLWGCSPEVRLRSPDEAQDLRVALADQHVCHEEPGLPCCPPATDLIVQSEEGTQWAWCQLADGHWDGPVIVIHPDEVVLGHYRVGAKHGTWRVTTLDGRVLLEQRYRDGELHGPWRSLDARGQPEATGTYLHGRKHGTWRAWSHDGQLLSLQSWRKGLRHGPWASWRHDGSPREEGRFLDDHKHGTWRLYHDSGALWKEGDYHHGTPVGTWTHWYASRWAGMRCLLSEDGSESCTPFDWRSEMLRLAER